MRPQTPKRKVDENLIRQLQVYKSSVAYIRVLESMDKDCISVQLTDNPGSWRNIPRECYEGFKELKRQEIGTVKLSVKFITPEQILAHKGPLLGLRIPAKECSIGPGIPDTNVYTLDTSLHYRERVLKGVQNIIGMSPHKKMEIIKTTPTSVKEV